MIWLVCNRRFRIIIAFMVVIFPVNISALIIGMIQETSFFRTKTNLRCNKSSFVWVCNANNIHICVRKNKSKQSYVWIESIFKAQNICFGSEIAGLLDHSYNKCALIMRSPRVRLLNVRTISVYDGWNVPKITSTRLILAYISYWAF